MPHGLYIHWPFCRRKCPYCAFVSYPDAGASAGRYAEALRREMQVRANGVFSGPPATIYLGGGTPSLIPAEIIAPMLGDISFGEECECSIEANPDSLSESWLHAIRRAGVNRLSIGVQATDDTLLAALGRIHSAERAEWAVRAAQKTSFTAISIDLMFGIPGQTMRHWRETLDRVLSWNIGHISAYSLGIEEDTPFFRQAELSGLSLPDASETADMYALMTERLREHGFRRYEISNFALPGQECRHNQGYWNFTPYLGIGASAHSFDGGGRFWNEPGLERYIERCFSGESPVTGYEPLDAPRRAIEELMLGLRTEEGLPLERYLTKYPGERGRIESRVALFLHERVTALTPEGNLILTDSGAMIADEIIAELMPDPGEGEDTDERA